MSTIDERDSRTPRDPYVLTQADAKEPPRGWRASLKHLGPGMVTSAAVVGSGELITATTLGAKVGFVLLWLVIVSTIVKVAVQIELARWSISTGKASITGYNQVPPKIAGRGWISYVGLLMFLQIIIGQGGVLGAGAVALSMLMPIGGDPFSMVSVAFWVILVVAVTVALHATNRYSVVERVSTVLVVLITVLTIAFALGLQFTPFAWSATDIATGMQFKLQAGTIGVALAMFGLTGIGAGEVTAYTYWCVEKGYARWAGPNDGSPEWVARARGWISVMKKDAFVAWIVYTISTIAFYILGAAVLHPQGLVPANDELLQVLSHMFTDVLGPWARWLFLFGAGVALIKTIIANAPGFARQMSNSLAVFGAFDWTDTTKRDRFVRTLVLALPVIWGLFYLFLQSPLTMIIVAGIGNAVFLIAVVIATLYLRRTETDDRVKDGPLFTGYLMISAVAVVGVGVLSLIGTLA